MQSAQLKRKKEDNLQLLLLYQRLIDMEQSCLTRFLRFEKSNLFLQFEKQYSVPVIIKVRIDDFIYLLLLMIEEIIFGVLPMDSANPFTTPYRISLALFFVGSFIVTISHHWFRWIVLFLICVGYPGLLVLTFMGYINLMAVDTSTQLFNYMGYLTLVPILILLVLIYPLKQFIRNKAGALYSYIYGLSITLIFYLWPLYSFINQISSTGSMSFNFITNNSPLITAFIVVIVTGIYFFVHNALFEPKLQRLQQLLLQQFSTSQLTTVLQQIEELQAKNTSLIYRNFHFFVRSMSSLIYAMTLAVQIFLYYKMVNNTSQMAFIGIIMGYVMIFQLFGAFLIYIRLSAVVTLPIIAVVSLTTAFVSFAYYSPTVNTYTYIFISISGPVLAIFWSLIKNISVKAIIFKINSIIVLFISIFLPFIALVINSFNYFTSDSSLVLTINYILIGVIVTTILFLLILFIIWQVSKYKIDSKGEQKSKVAVDYNYFEQGNPAYKHYEIDQKFNFGYLVNIDLRQIGYISGMIFFVCCELLSIHAVNLLNNQFATTTFYSISINQIIYAQFFIIFIFYIYSHCYLANPQESTVKNIFLVIFLILAIGFLTAGFCFSYASTTFKVIGGFSILMIIILFALDNIRQTANKIFGFVSSTIVISLWLFIVLPYVEIIPFVSIFADQNNFGKFIFGCIIGTVILLIFLVGVLTLIFNRFIDKFEQEKKYKFMMQDVISLFIEEGIQTQDDYLHILYQSFLYRDKKYVFFLKRGYPINLLQDPEDKITKLVSSQDYALKRIPTKKDLNQQQNKTKSCLWSCLTFCCGEDDEEIEQKLTKAKKIIDKEQLQSLLPKTMVEGLIKRQREQTKVKIKKNWKSPAKIYSSKSLILKNLHIGPRYLGDQFILLKTSKNADLAIQIWHNIFDFAANTDKGEALIISNDFHALLELVKIDLPLNQVDSIFFDLAPKKWGEHKAMDLSSFSIVIQQLANKFYSEKGEQAKFYLLIDIFFYNLPIYEEFNSFLVEKRTKQRVSRNQIKASPFQKSYQMYKNFISQKGDEQFQLIKKTKKYNNDTQIPLTAQRLEIKSIEQKQKVEQKGPSCKKIIFDKVNSCEKCCKKQTAVEDFQRKLFVRPWSLVSVEAVRIMQRKENEWGSVTETKQHPFRPISNNILMAVFKILDLYTYVSFSVMDSKVGWISSLTSSNLLIDYKIQTYLAMAAVAISVPFGIKGIMLIFEDRLGLTENRLPATFPHPMFFFTFLYKLMILSLFNTVTQTFLNTFNCNWQSTSSTYTLVDDTSIQCFSTYHTYVSLVSLICLIIYYPLSSYAMPNFQFAQKSLDLKYRPSYLIFYFQVQFVLLANKVLLNNINTSYTLEIVYISINIFALSVLALSIYTLKPCFIYWFNWVDFSITLVGVVIHTVGLVLYITGLWTVCVIVVSCVCGIIIIVTIIYIKKVYFSRKINEQTIIDKDNVRQLQLMWQYKQSNTKVLINFQQKKKNKAFTQIIPQQKGQFQQ